MTSEDPDSASGTGRPGSLQGAVFVLGLMAASTGLAGVGALMVATRMKLPFGELMPPAHSLPGLLALVLAVGFAALTVVQVVTIRRLWVGPSRGWWLLSLMTVTAVPVGLDAWDYALAGGPLMRFLGGAIWSLFGLGGLLWPATRRYVRSTEGSEPSSARLAAATHLTP